MNYEDEIPDLKDEYIEAIKGLKGLVSSWTRTHGGSQEVGGIRMYYVERVMINVINFLIRELGKLTYIENMEKEKDEKEKVEAAG